MSFHAKIIQGNTVVLNLAIAAADGEPFHLGDMEDIRWAMARSMQATDPPVLEKTLDDGIEIVDAAGGQLKITLLPSDTEALSGQYVHEVVLTDEDGNVSTVAGADCEPGTLIVRKRIAVPS